MLHHNLRFSNSRQTDFPGFQIEPRDNPLHFIFIERGPRSDSLKLVLGQKHINKLIREFLILVDGPDLLHQL